MFDKVLNTRQSVSGATPASESGPYQMAIDARMPHETSSAAPPPRWLIAIGISLALASWAAGVRAQERYSSTESVRPLVTPGLVLRFDAGASITTLPESDALLTMPGLGFTAGAPGIPWRGLELSTSLVDMLLAPSPPGVGYTPRFALTQRLSPSPSWIVPAESRETFELAARVQVGIDPLPGLPFRVEGSLPITLRAPTILRIDVTPGLGYQAVYERAVFDMPVRIVLQLASPFYLAAVSGVNIFDLGDLDSTAIPLGGQIGLTLTGDFGSLVDIVVDAGFPQLFVPSRDDSIDTDVFRVMAAIRIYTYWDLDATDPNQAPDAESRRRRCECNP